MIAQEIMLRVEFESKELGEAVCDVLLKRELKYFKTWVFLTKLQPPVSGSI